MTAMIPEGFGRRGPGNPEGVPRSDGPQGGAPIIEVEGLRKGFRTRGGPVEAVAGIDFRVAAGEFVAHDASFPFPGHWRLGIGVRTSEFDLTNAATEVTVH